MKVENITITAGETTPSVEFFFEDNHFRLSGMSYMEDVTSFYSEMLEKLKSHFENQQKQDIKFIFDLAYFNSSSSRIVFNLLEMLDEAAQGGNQVQIEWHFDDEDIGEEGIGRASCRERVYAPV